MSAKKASETETEVIFVRLLDEGTEAFRPALAQRLSGDIFQILAFPDFDPDDETPEFDFGDQVKCTSAISETGNYLRAMTQVKHLR